MLSAASQNCATTNPCTGSANDCHNFSFTTEIHTQFKCALSQHTQVSKANHGPRR